MSSAGRSTVIVTSLTQSDDEAGINVDRRLGIRIALRVGGDAPPQLLPGESWDVTVPVTDVAATVLLSATATVTPIVIDASGSTTAPEPITATANGWAVPWTLLLLVVALVALVVVALRLRKRRRTQQHARENALVKEAVELALEEVKAPTPVG